MKAILLIPPVVVLIVVVRAIRIARVHARFVTYERASNPAGFWLGIAIWISLALLLALWGFRVFITT